jgi:hypothetical protein
MSFRAQNRRGNYDYEAYQTNGLYQNYPYYNNDTFSAGAQPSSQYYSDSTSYYSDSYESTHYGYQRNYHSLVCLLNGLLEYASLSQSKFATRIVATTNGRIMLRIHPRSPLTMPTIVITRRTLVHHTGVSSGRIVRTRIRQTVEKSLMCTGKLDLPLDMNHKL